MRPQVQTVLDRRALIHNLQGCSTSMAVRCARYLRVSRTDQNAALQDDETRTFVERRGWEIGEPYVDKGVSGALDRRPQLDRMLDELRKPRNKMTVLVVYKSDRLFRSLRNMVN